MGFVKGIKRGISISSKILPEGIDHLELLLKRVASRVALAYSSSFILVIVAFILSYLLAMVMSPEQADSLMAAILMLFYPLIIFVSGTLMVSALLGAIQNVFYKKPLPFFNGENLKKAAKLQLFALTALLLLLVPVALAYALAGETAAAWAAIIIIILMLIAPFPILILLYYMLPEMAIKKKGIIDSMKSSITLVRNNFWETISFGFILGAVLFFIYAICAFLIYILFVLAILVSAVAATILATTALSILGSIIIFIGYIVYIAVVVALVSTIISIYSTMHTLFYKNLVKK